MMKYNITSLLHSFMLLLFLDILILVNSDQNIVNNNGSPKDDSLYSHSKVFAATALPKNVEIFKYHCTINLTLSSVNQMKHLHISKSFILNTIHDNISGLPKLKELTTTCRHYAEIKAYQHMLHRFLGTQNTSNISNATILSIMYLLQNAGESLQTIQHQNKRSYCHDFIGQEEKVYRILVANNDDNIDKVLTHLKLNEGWIRYRSHNEKFNVTHKNYAHQKCQLYTSLYRLVIKALTVL